MVPLRNILSERCGYSGRRSKFFCSRLGIEMFAQDVATVTFFRPVANVNDVLVLLLFDLWQSGYTARAWKFHSHVAREV